MDIVTTITSLFVDEENKIDKEQMRLYILRELSGQLPWVAYWLHGTENTAKWNDLANFIASNDRKVESKNWQAGLEQIMSLDQTIQGWRADHVDSAERLEFSVASKAAELMSRDEEADFFMALMIRHDQLLACVEIIKLAVSKLGVLAGKNSTEEIINSPEWEWFCNKNIDEYIYETAHAVYEEREKLGR